MLSFSRPPGSDAPAALTDGERASLEEARRWIIDPLSPGQRQHIEALLAHRPDEAQQIESLFRKAIHWQHAGYVLFGEKPLAGVEALGWQQLESQTPADREFNLQLHISAGEWAAWRRLSQLLPSSRFVLSWNPEDAHGRSDVTFCNVRAVQAAAAANAELYQALLGRPLSAPDFVEAIRMGQHPFTLLRQREDLLGVMLGYGRQNSRAFRRLCELQIIERTPSGPITRLRAGAEPSGAFFDAAEELAALQQSLRFVAAGDPALSPRAVSPVMFYGYPESPETKHLACYYGALQRELVKLENDPDFLLRVLACYGYAA